MKKIYTEKEQYSLIDIFKLFFAICIVMIHTYVFQNNTSNNVWGIYHGIFRLGVPFFFVCSGFFLGQKIYKCENYNDIINTIKNYIKRLLIPFCIWLIIGLPYKIYEFRYMAFSSLVSQIVKRVLFYPWGALWYIAALIVAIIILIPFIKKDKVKYAVFIGSILYIFALLCNNYYFVVEGTRLQQVIDWYLKNFISGRNGIFEGLLFVSSGVYVAKLLRDGINVNSLKNKVTLVISYIFLLVEIFLIKGNTYRDDHSLYISFIVLIPYLLMFLINFKSNINTKKVRDYSIGLYFIHPVIRDSVNILSNIFKIKLSSYEIFAIVLLLCLLILTILYKINNRYINKVIK